MASYARIERYARLWTSVVEYELRPKPAGTLFILHRPGARRLGMRLSNEATLASAVSIGRQVCSTPFTPLEVFLQHPAPKTTTTHKAWFGCPVRFDADLDAILLSPDMLQDRCKPNLPSVGVCWQRHGRPSRLHGGGRVFRSAVTINDAGIGHLR